MTYGTRGLGQTTTSIATLYQNKDAVFIVDSYRTQRLFQSNHPMLKDRIFTVEEVRNNKLMGRKCVLIWDNEAVLRYGALEYQHGNNRGRAEGMEEMLKKQEKKSQSEITPSYDTFKQLVSVLTQIGDLYGVNVFVVPKPKEK